MKDEFYKAISKINDTDLREACSKLADGLPAYFWTAPASSSGKYHPMCDLGEGRAACDQLSAGVREGYDQSYRLVPRLLKAGLFR